MKGENSAKILIVDDEPRNIKILQIQLKARGYTVLTAEDGFEALEVIATETPDLILLDINMPKMDGFQVAKRVRADKKTEFIPIVMITALRDTQENRIKAIEAGADDFIEKPFDGFEVVARIRSLLRIKHYQDTLAAHNARLEHELKMARSVQEILIPQNGTQDLAGFCIASHSCPTLAVGGDFFDVWEIEENRIGVFISDVMGHGVSAAFVTVFIKTLLTEYREQLGDNPAALMQMLNTRFNDIISSRLFMFATAFCAIFDLAKKQLICVNAGHPFPFLQHGPQTRCKLIGDKNTGNGLGIQRDSTYQIDDYPFDNSSQLLLYTDGAYEIKNPQGEDFTTERLQHVVETCAEQTPLLFIQRVSEAITTFANAHPNEDDMTLIAIKGIGNENRIGT